MALEVGPLAEAFSEVTVVGRMGARVDVRELPSGDQVTIFTVVVDRPAREVAKSSGRSVSVDSIMNSSFDDRAMRVSIVSGRCGSKRALKNARISAAILVLFANACSCIACVGSRPVC